MKTRYSVIVSVLLATAWRSYGVSALPESYLEYAVLILDAPSTNAVGSGFFLQASNSVYLATARHVLFEELATNVWQLIRPRIITSAFYCHTVTNEENVVFELDLKELRAMGEVRFSTNRDVALVRIESCNPTNKATIRLLPGVVVKSPTLAVRPTDGDYVKPGLDTSSVGLDVFVFGFPSSIGRLGNHQIDPDRPLLRKGIIAGLNPSRRTIIIDCPGYPGNSGGPVTVKEQISINECRFRTIGIIVEYISFSDILQSVQFKYLTQAVYNSGYSVVEPLEAILELVWQ